jgi:hypothetical protein
MKQCSLSPHWNLAWKTKEAAACLLAILLCSCGTPAEEEKIVEGRVVELDYQRVDSIPDGAWVEIDGHRFRHVAEPSEIDTNEMDDAWYPLPATSVVLDSSGRDPIQNRVPARSMPLRIAEYMNRIGETREGEAKYAVANRQLMLVGGVLRLVKADSSRITVRTSAQYPACVRTVETGKKRRTEKPRTDERTDAKS